ncbi:GQ67_04818T0 [Komagataella phaffii]|nr:GQ67_04818T0 [Komagataella phaffii]AOA70156.1 GQ68_04790T0 [Komagataella phaffii GS115]
MSIPHADVLEYIFFGIQALQSSSSPRLPLIMGATIDEDIKERIWNGKINIKVSLAPIDHKVNASQISFYTRLPRNSFLPIYLPQMLDFFASSIKDPEWANQGNWWFSFQDVPIRWNLPIGVNFDIMTGLNPDEPTLEEWNIILNYSNYPNTIVPIFNSKKSNGANFHRHDDRIQFFHVYWLNQMKESCYCINGNCNSIMSLSKTDSNLFWGSLLSHARDTFMSINQKHVPLDPLNIRIIPIRIHISILNKVIQPNVTPTKDDQKDLTTLGDILQETIPELFPSSLMYTIAFPITHGIKLPINLSLIDLYSYFAFSDGFVHISVVFNQPKPLYII